MKPPILFTRAPGACGSPVSRSTDLAPPIHSGSRSGSNMICATRSGAAARRRETSTSTICSSTRAQEAYGCIPFHQIKQNPRRGSTLALETAVAVDQQAGVVHREWREGPDLLGAREPELGLAGLAGAEDLAGAAQAQILLGDAEAVIGLAHQSEPRSRGFAEHIAAQQQADAVLVAAADPAAQLVQLGEAEAIGMLDDHQSRIGNV